MNVSNKRILQVIKLLEASEQTVTGKSLGIQLGVSLRTVRNDIKEANELLASYGAHVSSTPRVGYSLIIEQSTQYQEFREKYLLPLVGTVLGKQIVPSDHNDRITYIISRLLGLALQQRSLNQWELADELYVSVSTLKGYWHEIKASLQRFDLQLTADRTDKIRIRGDEVQIRHCISEYVFHSEELVDVAHNAFYADIFPESDIERVKALLYQAIEHYDVSLTDLAFRGLVVHILIIMKRQSDGTNVEYTPEELKRLAGTPYAPVVHELLNGLQREFNIDLDNEFSYLVEHFMTCQKFMKADDSGPENDEAIIAVHYMLSELAKEGMPGLQEDDELVSGLIMHLEAAMNRLRFNIRIRNDFLETVRNTCPLAFDVAVSAGKAFEQKTHIRMNENEIGFLAVHFGAALERCKGRAFTAIIVCGAGLATAKLIKSRLERRFGELLRIIKLCPSYALTEKDVQSVNYIFTTVSIKGMTSSKFIRLSPILTEEDIGHLSQLFTEENQTESYSEFFKEDLFFPHLSIIYKQQVLEYMSTQMLLRGYIDEEVRQSIMEREAMATTEIGGLIAIPHAIRNHMATPAVAIGILKEPIRWEKEQVQIVFMMSIPQDKYNAWEPLFRKIYTYFVRNLGMAGALTDQDYRVLLSKILV